MFAFQVERFLPQRQAVYDQSSTRQAKLSKRKLYTVQLTYTLCKPNLPVMYSTVILTVMNCFQI